MASLRCSKVSTRQMLIKVMAAILSDMMFVTSLPFCSNLASVRKVSLGGDRHDRTKYCFDAHAAIEVGWLDCPTTTQRTRRSLLIKSASLALTFPSLSASVFLMGFTFAGLLAVCPDRNGTRLSTETFRRYVALHNKFNYLEC